MVLHGLELFLGIAAIVGCHGTVALELQKALSIGGTHRGILFGTIVITLILDFIRINPFSMLINA